MQEVSSELECKVCLSSRVASVFLPCGHACACLPCYHSLLRHTSREEQLRHTAREEGLQESLKTPALRCPLCRERVLGAHKIFFG